MLAEIYGEPVWSVDEAKEEVLQVLCSVDVKDPQARKKIELWSNHGASCMTWAKEQIIVNNDISFAIEVNLFLQYFTSFHELFYVTFN